MHIYSKMKSALLLLAALFSASFAFAESGTETELNATGGGSSNAQVDGQSYYIAGTYIAGKGSAQTGDMTSQGFKLRTGTDGKRAVFTVNTNYTITSLELTGASNYDLEEGGTKDVSVVKVEVDGQEVAFTGGEAFKYKDLGESCTLSVTDIEAKESIAIYFDNGDSKGSQLNVSYVISWNRPDASQPTITVSPKQVALVPGASYKLSAKVDPASFTTLWASEDESIATVDEDGTVTAVAPGTVNIKKQWADDATVADAAVVTVADFDPAQYSVTKEFDFTAMGDVTLTIQETAAGNIWNEGNKKPNAVYFCTNEGLEDIAVQAVVSGNKGWSIVAEKGLFLASGAGRCAAIGNLTAGQIVEIIYTGEGFYTGNHEDAVRKDDGALKSALNEGVGRAIYKMEEDGLLGFELIKGNAVSKITVYEAQGVEPAGPYTVIWNEGAVFGNEGGFFALPVSKFNGVKAGDIIRFTVDAVPEEARAEAPRRNIKEAPSFSLWDSTDEGAVPFKFQEFASIEGEQAVDIVIDDAVLTALNKEGLQNIYVKGVNISIKQIELVEGTAIEEDMLEQTINHERMATQGYTATTATADLEAAKTFLGVDAITTDMLRIENPDGELISDYAPYDGWFDGEGKAETWGSNTKVCVKFFQAIPDGEFQICDMNGADEVGKTYTVRWRLVNGEKSVRYTINVTFTEFVQPEFKPEIVKTVDVTANLKAGTAYEGATATFNPREITNALGIDNLNDADQYIVNVTDGNFVANSTDGWRDANGDAATWGSGAGMVCVKINDPNSGSIDYMGAIDDTYKVGDTYTAKWGFVNTQNKAVVLNVNITFTEPDAINSIQTAKQQTAPVYNLAGQQVKQATKGLFIINGKKVVK